MKTLLILGILFLTGFGLWFYLIYPSYLSMNDCYSVAKTQAQEITEFDKSTTVYEQNNDEMCRRISQLVTDLKSCTNEQRQASVMNKIVSYYPPFAFNYQVYAERLSTQCLDTAPDLWQ